MFSIGLIFCGVQTEMLSGRVKIHLMASCYEWIVDNNRAFLKLILSVIAIDHGLFCEEIYIPRLL